MTKKVNLIINIILVVMLFSVILFYRMTKYEYSSSITSAILGIQQLNNAWYFYKKEEKKTAIFLLICAIVMFYVSIDLLFY